MSLIARARTQPRERRFGTWDDTFAEFFRWRGSGRSSAGQWVDTDRAMRLGAFMSAANLMCDLVSTMELVTYRSTPDGPVRTAPTPLIANPSTTVGSIGWRRQIIESMLLRGFAAGIVQQIGADGWPTQIEMVAPDLVLAHRDTPTSPVRYQFQSKPIDRWPAGPLWLTTAYETPGAPLGRSLVTYARETLGLGLAAHEHGGRWFGDGAIPAAILSSDQMINEEDAKAVKQRWVETTSEGRQPVVIGKGLEFKPLQVAPEESQFLETLKLNREEVVALVFPSTVLSAGAQITYANVEARTMDLLSLDVQPWLVRVETALSSLMSRPRYVKHNTRSLTRTTMLERFQAHKLAIDTGWETVAEVRAEEELPKIEGTDALRVPVVTPPIQKS